MFTPWANVQRVGHLISEPFVALCSTICTVGLLSTYMYENEFVSCLERVNPFPAVVPYSLGPGMVPLVLRVEGRPETTPVTPAHRSKASGGRDWVFPRGPKASLGSFRRSARTLALAVRVV